MGDRIEALPGDIIVAGPRPPYRDVLFMSRLEFRNAFVRARSFKDEMCIIISDSTTVDDPKHEHNRYRLVLWDGKVAWVNEASIKAVM